MIRNILEHIQGISNYPIIALIIFLLVFIAFTLWAFSLSREQVKHASELPLESDSHSTTGGEHHEPR